MFILFGSPRSGTTLLSSALDLHSEIAIPDETDFIVPLALICKRVKDPIAGKQLLTKLVTSTERFPDSLGEYLSEREVEETIAGTPYAPADILEALYGAIARKRGKRIAGDKSPNDLGSFGLLYGSGMFDSAIRIVHIVRDVRDVVLSLRTVGWAARPELTVPRPWCTSNLGLHHAFKESPERYLMIKFEDLVSAPRVGLERVCSFLGVRFEETMLEHANRGLRYRGVSHHQNLSRPFLVERAGAWRNEMDDASRRACEKQAAEALEVFGYPVGS
jgi:hypothetical protein